MIKKIKPTRILVFLISMVSLSRFFEAGRIIAEEQTFAHVPDSFVSLFVFVFTLFVLGYWVYEDEKSKNNLRVKFGLYEWVYKKLESKSLTKGEGKVK